MSEVLAESETPVPIKQMDSNVDSRVLLGGRTNKLLSSERMLPKVK